MLSNNITHEILQTKKTWTWGHNYFTCNCVNAYKIGLNLFWYNFLLKYGKCSHLKLKILVLSKYSKQNFKIESLKIVIVTSVRSK